MWHIWANTIRQVRRFWVSSLTMVLGVAVGVFAVSFTLGNTLDMYWRAAEVVPPDQEVTATLSIRGGEVTSDQVYEALKGIPSLTAVVLNQPYNLGPADARGVAVSLRLISTTWHPPLLQGRFLTPADTAPNSPPRAVIGVSLARKWFASEDVVGKEIDLTGGLYPPFQIIGVIGLPNRISAWDQAIFLPGEHDRGRRIFTFELKGESTSIMDRLRQDAKRAVELASPGVVIDPNPPPAVPADNGDATRSLAMMILLAVLVLATAGVNCGHVALSWVIRRKREIAIRMAMGASPRQVVQLIMGEVFILHLAGAGLGLLVHSANAWYARGEGALQWSHIAVAFGAAILSGTFAGLSPAITASRISPAEAMQLE